jgi:hypothetical protein
MMSAAEMAQFSNRSISVKTMAHQTGRYYFGYYFYPPGLSEVR